MSNLSDVIGGAHMYGSLTNILFVNDRFCNANSAIFFNNASSLKVPSGVFFSGDFTITVWIYLKAALPDDSRLIDFGNGNYTDNIYVKFWNSMKISYFISINSTTAWTYEISTYSLLELNKWFHVTLTLSGTTGYVYVNGSLAATSATIVPRNVLRNINYIGKLNQFAIFDDLKFYQGAMSQTQILNDYIASSNNGIILFFSKI